MTKHIFDSPPCYTDKPHDTHIAITLLGEGHFKSWLKKRGKAFQSILESAKFDGKAEDFFVDWGKDSIANIIFVVPDAPERIHGATLYQNVTKSISDELLKQASFSCADDLSDTDLADFYLGWGLGAYCFDAYKGKNYPKPSPVAVLKIADKAVRASVRAKLDAIALTRNLINVPANDMGPDELQKAVDKLCKTFKAKLEVAKDKELIKNNFPAIYVVGHASPRRPRLLDLTWGNEKHPSLTLVGKGVCFDTGGLDLKPSQYMRHMKKDMGGAAHALGLAQAIMALNLPVYLRVLIPAVENSVAGEAFRPGDVLQTRKGITIENTNTDAEGRLILSDALTYACEAAPDLVMDFATLTGSARAALGHDIPAMFSNDDDTAQGLQESAMAVNDPLWRMPLWSPYKKHIKSSVGDIVNSAGIPGDLIYSALFLQEFVDSKTKWVHLDMFAWEHSGRPGRPAGGADTGLLACLSYIQDYFCK